MKTKVLGIFCLCVTCLGASFNTAFAKPYKAAEIYTQDSMLYGKYVLRMKAAKGSGIISNFFLWKDGSELSSVFWEEVDFEVFGRDNAESWQSNIITGLNSRQTSEGVHPADFSFGDDYHTFTLEWTPNYVAWFVDDVEVRRDTGGQVDDLITDSTIRLNFWAPDIPAWVGNFNDSILPVEMFVNWAEYHSWNGSGSDFNFEWRDDFDEFDTTRWVKAQHTFGENLTDFVPQNAVVQDGYLVLAMTHEGEEGFNGTVPVDSEVGNPAPIVLTNNSSASVNGWAVDWQYDDGSSLTNSWNGDVTGTGPFNARPIGWNATISPGQSVSFGLVGVKGSSTVALVPEITGDVCQ